MADGVIAGLEADLGRETDVDVGIFGGVSEEACVGILEGQLASRSAWAHPRRIMRKYS